MQCDDYGGANHPDNENGILRNKCVMLKLDHYVTNRREISMALCERMADVEKCSMKAH